MLRKIFVTGAGGFIGKNFIQRQSFAAERRFKILTRIEPATPLLKGGLVEPVLGDLLKPETYRAALEGCDAVVHLAAATGRTIRSEYQRINVDGTMALLQACKIAGVQHFLHVSTIAAGYPDQRYYHYAQTKLQAESLVRESGLDFALLRPTIVLGENSPIWKVLVKIASLPVVPLPQGQPVRVQPIHVNDVARGIDRLLERDHLNGEILELGGPRQMLFSEFLQLIQIALRGAPGKIVRVPLSPFRFGLAALEPLLRPVMPVTAGQLSVFANDSVASENWLLAELRASMPSTQETIAALVPNKVGRSSATQSELDSSLLPALLSVPLVAECRAFTSYLVGCSSSPYVEECYILAAQEHGLADEVDFSCFDRATLRVARLGCTSARWADSYCALFRRNGILRRKLILLAAILEHVSPTSKAFDDVEPSSLARTFFSIGAFGLTSVVSVLIGAMILFPAGVVCWLATRIMGSVLQTRQTR
jgi:nucleoside-diphosphate-sugar epimerase